MPPFNSRSLLKITNPLIQVCLALLIMAVSNAVVKLLIVGGMSFEVRAPWTLNIAFVFLFAMYNVILGLVYSTKTPYWLISIFCFIVLSMVSGAFSHWLSGLEIDEAGSYRWLYFVFFIVYMLIMVIILAIKKIVQMAEQDDRRFDNINNYKN